MGKAKKLHRKKVQKRNEQIRQNKNKFNKVVQQYIEQMNQPIVEDKPNLILPGINGPQLG